MTTSTLSLKSSSNNWYKAWYYIAIVPFYAIQKWFALFLITTGTLYASAEFNMQHGVFPPVVAYTLAVGIEWTYLSGLAYATELKNTNSKSTWMIIMGAFTSGMFGVMYILGHYNVIPISPTGWVAWTLAFLHVLPLIILLFLYTLCKRDYLSEQNDITSKSRDREEKWRDEKLLLEIEREKIDLEIKTETERIRLERERIDLEKNRLSIEPAKPAKVYTCPKCHSTLTQQQSAVANRWGHCPSCKHT